MNTHPETIAAPALDHRAMYRLPWNLPDNAISWLEPTSACNLACDGCYRENVAGGHKTLDEVRTEIETFKRLRNCDGISIAGGDPLLHPEIVEIVRSVAASGIKPILNTNGAALTMDLLRALKQAGVMGFTFHVDSRQGRPGWKRADEIELNALRLEYAEMLAEAGGISCSFNSTVYEDTRAQVPDMMAWAAAHIDIVQVMVFILYRQAVPQLPYDWYVGGEKIAYEDLHYHEEGARQVDMKAPDLVATIRERFPEFSPCAYLNGTEQADSFKWLLAGRIGTKQAIHGYIGPKFMETMQAGHHLFTGRYLAYAKPHLAAKGRSMLLFSPFDRGVRSAAGSYLRSLMSSPARLFDGLHYQSVMIIQPVDFLPNGYQNMCDGCPDMTVWNGELVWSCRLEELKQFGQWARTVPVSSPRESE
jgi:hypothetical protein